MDFSVSIEIDLNYEVKCPTYKENQIIHLINISIPTSTCIRVNDKIFKQNNFLTISAQPTYLAFDSQNQSYSERCKLFELMMNNSTVIVKQIKECDSRNQIERAVEQKKNYLISTLESFKRRAENAHKRFVRDDHDYSSAMFHAIDFKSWSEASVFYPLDCYQYTRQSLLEEYIKPLVDEFTWMMITGE
ncbi:hypothetical protein [Aeromonas caviae]|uniref:hypothetical protein n=1 Tax=Aeromonas caviae TaxID=648 RepID=UPI00224FD6E0|nr:hypothetical protein [Aeromonas caviae]MCX4071922.1 hypothetical protein [Aeromonas caviae]